MSTFPKDRWIRDALARKYLLVSADGSIMRCVKAAKDGTLLSEIYKPIVYTTHRATDRVYFNMTWRGYTKSVLVNRVVAWAFHPNPDNLPQVNHKDGVKANNGRDNLEWASGSDNEKHAHRTGLKSGRGTSNSNVKLKAVDVTAIRSSLEKAPVLAKRYGVSRSTIVNVIARRTWQHL